MSGTKNPLFPVKVLSAADLSQATITSPATGITYQDNICYQAVITGTPVGTLDVQVSTNYLPTTGLGNWVSLGASYTATVNGAGGGIFDINQLSPCYVRVLYTKSSGTGSMDLTVSAKQV